MTKIRASKDLRLHREGGFGEILPCSPVHTVNRVLSHIKHVWIRASRFNLLSPLLVDSLDECLELCFEHRFVEEELPNLLFLQNSFQICEIPLRTFSIL